MAQPVRYATRMVYLGHGCLRSLPFATAGWFLSQTVIQDVTATFENQSLEELAEQQTKIQEMLDSGKASVDSEFWEAVLKELHVFQVTGFCVL